MKTTHTAESPEQLLEKLHTIIAEAERTLGASVRDGAEDSLGGIRERLEGAKDTAQHLFVSARKKVVEGAKQADATIRSHPYESLAVALGVGVLLGALLARRSS